MTPELANALGLDPIKTCVCGHHVHSHDPDDGVGCSANYDDHQAECECWLCLGEGLKGCDCVEFVPVVPPPPLSARVQ
jgi:hypothetical protein